MTRSAGLGGRQGAPLRDEVLAALRDRQQNGQLRITVQDVAGDVLLSRSGLLALADPMTEADVGPVAEALAPLLAGLPRSGPWDAAVGPVYLTTQVRALLGRDRPVSRQAVADRLARRTLLGMTTRDRRAVYPAWQFQGRQVLAGLPAVLQAFLDEDGRPVVDDWTLASWLRTPLDTLDGHSVADRLATGALESATAAAGAAAARWAR